MDKKQGLVPTQTGSLPIELRLEDLTKIIGDARILQQESEEAERFENALRQVRTKVGVLKENEYITSDDICKVAQELCIRTEYVREAIKRRNISREQHTGLLSSQKSSYVVPAINLGGVARAYQSHLLRALQEFYPSDIFESKKVPNNDYIRILFWTIYNNPFTVYFYRNGPLMHIQDEVTQNLDDFHIPLEERIEGKSKKSVFRKDSECLAALKFKYVFGDSFTLDVSFFHPDFLNACDEVITTLNSITFRDHLAPGNYSSNHYYSMKRGDIK